MMRVAEIFLISTDGEFIMQHRDDNPEIANPGMITAFGGRIEDYDKSPRHAAAREGREETSLDVEVDDLEDFGSTRKTMAEHGEDTIVYWYVLRDVNLDDVNVLEGQGYYLIKPIDNLDDINLSIEAKRFILQNITRLTAK